MKEKQKNSKTGRKLTKIDWDFVKNLALAGCCGVEIAQDLGLRPETLYKRCQSDNGVHYSDFVAQFEQKGKNLLKVQQFLKAIGQDKSGDSQLLIFLGKSRLKQTDQPENPKENRELEKASMASDFISLANEKFRLEIELQKKQLDSLANS